MLSGEKQKGTNVCLQKAPGGKSRFRIICACFCKEFVQRLIGHSLFPVLTQKILVVKDSICNILHTKFSVV